MNSYPFSPRFKFVAYAALVLGAVALTGAIIAGGVSGWVIGLLCISSGAAYLLSPAWKIVIETNENGITVFQKQKTRFSLPWSSVERFLVMPDEKAAFVDGGSPEKSVLIPGPGAQAGYQIVEKAALIREISKRIPAHRIKAVENLRPPQKTTS